MKAIIVILLASALAPPILARSQEAPADRTPPPGASIRATRTAEPPAIDGVLDDACWKGAPAFENFTEVTPVEGAAPSERTIVRVLYDEDQLYIAVRCLDSDAGKVLGKEKRRDSDMSGDDHVEIVIDPFDDRRNGYYFQLSAGGAKADGLIDTSKGQVRLEWDGLWDGRTSRDADGWTAEIAIPFKTISFDPDARAWGFNVQRTIRRKQEVVRWASPRTNSDISRLSDAGVLLGIEGIRQGIGLTLKPYLTVRRNTVDPSTRFQPGMDVFYNLTPSTTLAATVNTDFAETDVDQRIVNLTRFPIFFPEKRAFFLQDATVFSFGGIFQSPVPFYSRRIGIVGGLPKDILAGVRVTGRQGGLNFGAMDVQMKDDPALGAKNLFVGRLSANVLDQSTAGFIFTHGDPATTGDNTLLGGDFNFRTRSLFGDKVLEAHGWLIGSLSDRGPERDGADRGTGEDGGAVGGRLSYPNDRWNWGLFAGRYGSGFRPALGFIERPGTYELHANFRRRWRPQAFIRRVDLKSDQGWFLNLDGSVQTQDGGLAGAEVEDRYGDVFDAEVQSNREVLTEPFEISDGVTIPVGDYRFNRAEASVQMAASRPFSPGFTFRTGDFYAGRRTDYVAGLNWRPGSWFFASAGYEYDSVDLPQGSFIVRIMSVRADLLFSPQLTWSTIAQYDNATENLGLYSRVRWEFRLGQEIFFVVRQSYLREDGRGFTNVSGDMTLKAGLTFRF